MTMTGNPEDLSSARESALPEIWSFQKADRVLRWRHLAKAATVSNCTLRKAEPSDLAEPGQHLIGSRANCRAQRMEVCGRSCGKLLRFLRAHIRVLEGVSHNFHNGAPGLARRAPSARVHGRCDWCPRSDLHRHFARFKRAVSALGYVGKLVPREGFPPPTSQF